MFSSMISGFITTIYRAGYIFISYCILAKFVPDRKTSNNKDSGNYGR